MTPSTKTLKILLKMLAAPRRYTKRQLGKDVGLTDPKAIKKHLDSIEAAGIQVKRDKHHRHYVLVRPGFRELDYLNPLSDNDKLKIKSALNYLSDSDSEYIMQKLESLFDFQQLGLESLRTPELEKIDSIEEAMRTRRQVILINYRSRNSNNEINRKVEPFGLEPEIGMIRAYDHEKNRTSHFMLSRFDRVEVLDRNWIFESLHQHKPADCFNIVNNRTTMVRLILNISAYNDLIERHPATRQHIREGATPNTYDFQARINQDFIGLIHFILSNWKNIEVISPESLKKRLRSEAIDMATAWS